MKSNASFVITSLFTSAAVLIGTVFSINTAHKLGDVNAPNFSKLDGVSAFDKTIQNENLLEVETRTTITNPQPEVLDQSERYREAQVELKRLGLYEGTVDGQWGPQSRSSLQNFLKQTNRTGNGWLTAEISTELKQANISDFIPSSKVDISSKIKPVEIYKPPFNPPQELPGKWEMLSPLLDGNTGNPYEYSQNSYTTFGYDHRNECDGYMFMSLDIPSFSKLPVTAKATLVWKDTTPYAGTTEEDYTFTTNVEVNYSEDTNKVSLKPGRVNVRCKLTKLNRQNMGNLTILSLGKRWDNGEIDNGKIVFTPIRARSNYYANLAGTFYKK